MLWIVLGAPVAVTATLVYLAWRKWIAPWRQIDQLVRQIGRGEQPRTFLIDGAREAQRIAVALEAILPRQRTLDRQVSDQVSGQEAIFFAIRDGLLVVDAERRVALLNPTFAEWCSLSGDCVGAPLLHAVRDAAVAQAVDAAL